MKRIFGRSAGKEKEEEIQDVSLDILLANKEDIITKLKNEYKSFLARKVEIERDLVEVESQEVELRELDLANKTEELGKINDTNKSHQEKVSEQLEILEIKLLEHKALHRQNEIKLEAEIDQMSADLEEVKKVLQNKINEFGEDCISLPEDQSDLDGSIITTRVSSLFVEVGDLDDRLESNDCFSEAEN